MWQDSTRFEAMGAATRHRRPTGRCTTSRWGFLTGAVLVALPIVKGTGLSLYPVAGLVFIASLWRRHSRSDLLGWLGVALGAVLVAEFSSLVLSSLQPASSATGSGAISA